MERRDAFETWRAPSGERWQRSIVTPADGSYRVEGEWRSDATGLPQAVRGLGAIAAEPLEVAIQAQPGRSALTIRRGAREPEILDGRCTPDCYVDLSPSAVAMFAMTRDARVKVGGAARVPLGRACAERRQRAGRRRGPVPAAWRAAACGGPTAAC